MAVNSSLQGKQHLMQMASGNRCLFHRLTRTAYLYNGCLAWYNVVLTRRVHSSVKYSQQSQLRTRATVK